MGRTKNRITCGQFGGRNAKGEPCGVSVIDGPCTKHAGGASRSAYTNPGAQFMTPPFERTRDKVCIVGFTGHRDAAMELDRSEWEIWGLNELYRYMPIASFDRWFEIHGREYLEKDDDGKKHIEDLKTISVPIYMQVVHPDIPCSVMFPRDELIEKLGSSYWTNCPAWMLGMAIAMGFKEIAMVGIDMAQDTEYSVQRPCCEYWLGRAEGMGIKTWVPDQSDLLKCIGLYGYQDSGSILSRKLEDRLSWLHEQDNERLAALRKLDSEYENKTSAIRRSMIVAEGAIEELKLAAGEGPEREARVEAREAEIAKGHELLARIQAEYSDISERLKAERNQIVGGIQNTNYILRSWLVKSDNPKGGLIPNRSEDPRTGIKAAAGDSRAVSIDRVFSHAI
jgi:hypothetical protein